jgi:PadR family transcriptional regulator, regulatory protein AphA
LSSRPLTPTSYAVLGLLAVRPWSSYELTRQMHRSLGHMWPRAASKLYEEPKKLVAHGLARATTRHSGARPRTVYTITAAGRRALAAWLNEPGAGPVLEFEQLVQVFFAENGRKPSLTATLAAAEEWARTRLEESRGIGEQYAAGTGPFPERLPQLQLTSRFLTDFYALVGEWARWAASVVETWPDDVRAAEADPAIILETLHRASSA